MPTLTPSTRSTEALRPLLRSLELTPEECVVVEAGGSPDDSGDALRELCARELTSERRDHTLLLLLPEVTGEHALAAWRNVLWPVCHVGTLVQKDGSGRLTRTTLQERAPLDVDTPALEFRGTALVARHRASVLEPRLTVEKFDKAAAGWNGFPGSPGYPHHRWMRRFVGLFSEPRAKERILDFGCGAGWVGIEAARANPGATLCAFDPSPQMVEFAGANARASGITDFVGRTGFGETPPFPAEGEEPFDLVISSGVVSFAFDRARWFDGLAACVAPGGTLVLGDIHPGSRGMRNRRRTKPLLPIREMNAMTREEARTELESRGFRHVRSSGYQLTNPVPQAMHLNETRLKGALTWPLLGLNALGAKLDGWIGSPLQDHFDSWVMHLHR